MIQSSQLLKLLHQKIVLKQRVIFTIQRAPRCSPFLSLSKTVTLSVRLEICWHGRSAQEWKSNPGVLPVSVSFVCSCRDRFRLCYTNVSVQWDGICTVISWAWWCCWWSRHQKKGRKVMGGAVGFAASLLGKHTELWSKHLHIHRVHVLMLVLTPGDKGAGYFQHSF